MRVDVKVDGLQHLEKVLTEMLPAKAQTKVMVRALKRSARPMVNAVRSGYRSLGGSGALAQSVSAWQRRKGALRGDTFASVEIGPKRGNRAALRKYYQHYRKAARPKTLIGGIRHGHLIEFGFRHRGGKSVAGKGIMGGAFQRHSRSAVDGFGKVMGAEIEREAARLGRLQGGRR